MTVYIVVSGEAHEGYGVVDVFESFEDADALRLKLESYISNTIDYVDVLEWEVK